MFACEVIKSSLLAQKNVEHDVEFFAEEEQVTPFHLHHHLTCHTKILACIGVSVNARFVMPVVLFHSCISTEKDMFRTQDVLTPLDDVDTHLNRRVH